MPLWMNDVVVVEKVDPIFWRVRERVQRVVPVLMSPSAREWTVELRRTKSGGFRLCFVVEHHDPVATLGDTRLQLGEVFGAATGSDDVDHGARTYRTRS